MDTSHQDEQSKNVLPLQVNERICRDKINLNHQACLFLVYKWGFTNFIQLTFKNVWMISCNVTPNKHKWINSTTMKFSIGGGEISNNFRPQLYVVKYDRILCPKWSYLLSSSSRELHSNNSLNKFSNLLKLGIKSEKRNCRARNKYTKMPAIQPPLISFSLALHISSAVLMNFLVKSSIWHVYRKVC